MAMGRFSTAHSLAALAVPLQAQPQSFPREAAPGCPPQAGHLRRGVVSSRGQQHPRKPSRDEVNPAVSPASPA